MKLVPDKTKKEFDDYINDLDQINFCKYSESITNLALFCNCNYSCKYRSERGIKHRNFERFECNHNNPKKQELTKQG